MSICPKCRCEVDDMALCCPGCLGDHPLAPKAEKKSARADKAERLAMLSDGLADNERLFRDGKRDAKTYAVCKRDVKRRMAEIRATKAN